MKSKWVSTDRMAKWADMAAEQKVKGFDLLGIILLIVKPVESQHHRWTADRNPTYRRNALKW